MKILSFLKCLFSIQHRCDMLYFTLKLLYISKPESLLYVSSGDTVDCYEGQIPNSSLLDQSQNQVLHVDYHWFFVWWVCLLVCFPFQDDIFGIIGLFCKQYLSCCLASDALIELFTKCT